MKGSRISRGLTKGDIDTIKQLTGKLNIDENDGKAMNIVIETYKAGKERR